MKRLRPNCWTLLFTILLGIHFNAATLAQDKAAEGASEAKDSDSAKAQDEDFDLELQLKSFDEVWSTIKRVHWDKELVGDSWDAARDKYRPIAEKAESIDDIRSAIEDLLDTLDQSHFGVIPQDAYKTMSGDDDEEEEDSTGAGIPGMEIRYVEKRLVVTRVFEGMPAEKAGVQPGWEVKMIGKRTSDALINRAKVSAEHSVNRVDTSLGLICDNMATGEIGKKLTMVFIDHDGKVVLKEINLVDAPGKMEKFGNLPSMRVHFESKELDDEIGYIAFNAFIGGPRLIREYQKALADYRNSNGIIIDMRGNHGGLVGLVSGMCNFFATSKDPIGTMTQSGGTVLKLASNPRKLKIKDGDKTKYVRFDRPVAVLTDSCSISAAEIMAGGIKDLKLGRVFGGTTAGLSLPSTVVRLPNGDGFQFAIASYVSANGESIEGTGVIPNEPIELTRKLLEEQGDPVLEAAKKWILEQGQGDQ